MDSKKSQDEEIGFKQIGLGRLSVYLKSLKSLAVINESCWSCCWSFQRPPVKRRLLVGVLRGNFVHHCCRGGGEVMCVVGGLSLRHWFNWIHEFMKSCESPNFCRWEANGFGTKWFDTQNDLGTYRDLPLHMVATSLWLLGIRISWLDNDWQHLPGRNLNQRTVASCDFTAEVGE